MAKESTPPTARELQAIRQDLTQDGRLTKCIKSGFTSGALTFQQASDLKKNLSSVVDYCQAQQAIIFNLQAELARVNQATLFS